MKEDAIITVIGTRREHTQELADSLHEEITVVKVLVGVGLITIKAEASELKQLRDLDWISSADPYDPDAPRKFRFEIRPKKPRKKPAAKKKTAKKAKKKTGKATDSKKSTGPTKARPKPAKK